MAGQPGFFDLDERYRGAVGGGRSARAAGVGGRLRAVPAASSRRRSSRSDRARGGRPPYDAVLMFKVLVLQTLYTLSDDQTEYQLRDRLSFMRFVGLALRRPGAGRQDDLAVPRAADPGRAPSSGCSRGSMRRCATRGYLAMGGQIVDATIVEARRPRLTQEEKATVKGGGVPEDWSKAQARADRPRRPLDAQARPQAAGAARRRGPHGGARDRGADVRLQEPRRHRPRARLHPPLHRHPRRRARRRASSARLLDPGNTASAVWADTAYRSAANLALLARRGLVPQFQRPKPRGKPMPPHIARGNATPGAGPGRGRARLRRPEVPARPGHPHGRPGPRHGQARARQPGHQHAPPRLVRDASRHRPEPSLLQLAPARPPQRTDPAPHQRQTLSHGDPALSSPLRAGSSRCPGDHRFGSFDGFFGMRHHRANSEPVRKEVERKQCVMTPWLCHQSGSHD